MPSLQDTLNYIAHQVKIQEEVDQNDHYYHNLVHMFDALVAE